MNDETFLEDNERFKFNDVTIIGKQEQGRKENRRDITERESASGAECIGLIGVAITHPRVKPRDTQPLCTISVCPADPSRNPRALSTAESPFDRFMPRKHAAIVGVHTHRMYSSV